MEDPLKANTLFVSSARRRFGPEADGREVVGSVSADFVSFYEDLAVGYDRHLVGISRFREDLPDQFVKPKRCILQQRRIIERNRAFLAPSAKRFILKNARS